MKIIILNDTTYILNGALWLHGLPGRWKNDWAPGDEWVEKGLPSLNHGLELRVDDGENRFTGTEREGDVPSSRRVRVAHMIAAGTFGLLTANKAVMHQAGTLWRADTEKHDQKTDQRLFRVEVGLFMNFGEKRLTVKEVKGEIQVIDNSEGDDMLIACAVHHRSLTASELQSVRSV